MAYQVKVYPEHNEVSGAPTGRWVWAVVDDRIVSSLLTLVSGVVTQSGTTTSKQTATTKATQTAKSLGATVPVLVSG
jgi:hypothetical protein